jgi:hypothetical protein
MDEHGRLIPTPDGNSSEKERTLTESIVTDFSWPCVLVFVRRWESSESLATDADMIPKFLFCENGSIIPTCVVVAPEAKPSPQNIDESKLNFPTNKMGGGFPVKINSQQQEHIATASCLVSDGHTYYLLTNRHVAGPEGQIVTSRLGGDEVTIGSTNGQSLAKMQFTELYPGWKGQDVQVNCDAGLIYLDDINEWKTDVLGIGTLGTLYDLNTQTMTLGLIAEHGYENRIVKDSICGNVIASSAVSGMIKGEVLALFYRYESMGGIEYVSDFLICGRNTTLLNTHPGDSGSLWCLEDEDDDGNPSLRPLALHWGQHQFLGADKLKYPFALATNLTNICRQLDVQVVRDWNLDEDYTWGKVGHYTVGFQAIQTVKNNNLKTFLTNNTDRISFTKENINATIDEKNNPQLVTDPTKGFCPLADVPDLVWKQPPFNPQTNKGSKWGRAGMENPNHFADADFRTANGTLYDMCPTADKVTVDNWTAYYQAMDDAFRANNWAVNPAYKRGLISFRVWQIFDYITAAAKQGNAAQFLFGAGVLAHYVGDGCQPLHGSYMADGDPADDKSITYTPPRGGSKHPAGVPYQKTVNAGNGVHSAYEDKMIDTYIGEIMQKLQETVDKQDQTANNLQSPEVLPKITNGQEAGFAVLQLMKLAQQDIHPKDLVEAYKTAKSEGNDISKALHDQFIDQTITVLARGSRYLGHIWQAAWENGTNNINNFAAVKQTDLQNLYKETTNLQSYHLDTIWPFLKH